MDSEISRMDHKHGFGIRVPLQRLLDGTDGNAVIDSPIRIPIKDNPINSIVQSNNYYRFNRINL